MNNLTPDKKVEAMELINLLEDVKDQLDEFSVYNDDIFDVQTVSLDNLILDFKRQL